MTDPIEPQDADLQGYVAEDPAPSEPEAPVAPPPVALDDATLERLARVLVQQTQQQPAYAPPLSSEPEDVDPDDPRDLIYDRDQFAQYVQRTANARAVEDSVLTKWAAIQEFREQFGSELDPAEVNEVCQKIQALEDVAPLKSQAHLKEGYAILGRKLREQRSAPQPVRLESHERSQALDVPSAVPTEWARDYAESWYTLTGNRPTMQQIREAYKEFK